MSINEFNPHVNPIVLEDLDWINMQLKKDKLEYSYRRISNSNDLDKFKYSHKFINRVERIYNCARYIEFKRTFSSNELKVHKFYTCKDRLCPGCNPRRSRKIYNQFKKIVDYCSDDYEFLFLTLTVRNCEMDELDELISHMFHSWKKMCKRKEFHQAIKGWYRALEVTFDHDEFIIEKKYNKSKAYFDNLGLGIGDKNPNYKKFHPHFHCLLAVKKSYFKSDEYLSHGDFVRLWLESLDVDYAPVVDIRKVRKLTSDDEEKSKSDIISEVAKYTVKDTDYLIDNDLDLTDLTVYHLALSLQGRRLIAFGGDLKKIHKMLNLDDPVDGDLVNVDEELIEDDDYVIECYKRQDGAKGMNYYLSSLKLPEHIQPKEELDQGLLFRNSIKNELNKNVRKKNVLNCIDEYNMNLSMGVDFIPKDRSKNKKINLDKVVTINKPPVTFDIKSVLRLFNHNNVQISKIGYKDLTFLNYYMQFENKNSSLSKKVLKSCMKNLSNTDDYRKRSVLVDIRDYLEATLK